MYKYNKHVLLKYIQELRFGYQNLLTKKSIFLNSINTMGRQKTLLFLSIKL